VNDKHRNARSAHLYAFVQFYCEKQSQRHATVELARERAQETTGNAAPVGDYETVPEALRRRPCVQLGCSVRSKAASLRYRMHVRRLLMNAFLCNH